MAKQTYAQRRGQRTPSSGKRLHTIDVQSIFFNTRTPTSRGDIVRVTGSARGTPG
jgi:hypothetical protein